MGMSRDPGCATMGGLESLGGFGSAPPCRGCKTAGRAPRPPPPCQISSPAGWAPPRPAVFCLRHIQTETLPDVLDLGCGAVWIVCPECGGDGDWRKFHPEPELHPEGFPCVECKGTGWVLVS